MSRIFPIAVLLLATLLGGGGGYLVNTALRYVVALPDGASVQAPVPGDPATPQVAAAKAAPRLTTEKTYMESILCRNLFDREMVGQCSFNEKPVEGQAEGDSKTDLNVTLLGTLVAEPASYSSALIAQEGADRPDGYSIGDKIKDAEITAIEKKLVRLRRGDGREEVLTMSEEAQPKSSPSTASKPVASKGGDDEVTELGENHYAISSETLDKYLSDIESIAGMGRALLHRGPDGEFDGYRLSAIRRNTIADKLGIRNGDIIHSVNGKPLNSMQAAMEAYNTMQNEKNFSFEVTRRGQQLGMKYDVQ